MGSSRWRWVVRFLVIAVVIIAALSAVVMSLWNWLAPPLFGWSQISFVQAAGLLLLCRILFGGLRGGYAAMHWRRRLAERWEQMSPEERERMRAGMRGCCRRQSADASETGQTASTV